MMAKTTIYTTLTEISLFEMFFIEKYKTSYCRLSCKCCKTMYCTVVHNEIKILSIAYGSVQFFAVDPDIQRSLLQHHPGVGAVQGKHPRFQDLVLVLSKLFVAFSIDLNAHDEHGLGYR